MSKIISMVTMVFAMLIPQLKKEDSTEGINEINDVIKALNETSLILVNKLKDGAQLSDATEFIGLLMTDEKYKKCLTDAVDGWKLIPAQAKDIDAGEGLEIANLQLSYIPAIMDALNKEEV